MPKCSRWKTRKLCLEGSLETLARNGSHSALEKEDNMELEIIGLGRMRSDMVRQVQRADRQHAVHNTHPKPVDVLVKEEGAR